MLLLVGAGIGVAFSRNLVLAFALWELATVSLWRLVGFSRRESDGVAANWALYVNFAATALMLVGIVLLWQDQGSLDLAVLTGRSVTPAAAWLLLAGIFAKSATLPLYIWLPRAYRAAPAPVCALLSGVAENVGVVLFYRLFVVTMLPPAGFAPAAAGLAVVSSLVAGGIALGATTVRGLLAYSTVSQLGFVMLGFAVGGRYGLLGGLLYLAGHAVAKAGLFYAAGAVSDSTGTDELDSLGGQARRSPALAAATAILVFSVIGLPPMVGFFAKLGVVVGAASSSVPLALGAIVAAVFTLLYLGRFYAAVFLGEPVGPAGRPVSRFAVALVIVMALVSVAAGLAWFLPVGLVEPGLGHVAGAL
jgi:formate hydrogenlyase subunit 3/multisubunit Na+/H+ antiporter MnhD subunit